jgi:hypothetical protein
MIGFGGLAGIFDTIIVVQVRALLMDPHTLSHCCFRPSSPSTPSFGR